MPGKAGRPKQLPCFLLQEKPILEFGARKGHKKRVKVAEALSKSGTLFLLLGKAAAATVARGEAFLAVPSGPFLRLPGVFNSGRSHHLCVWGQPMGSESHREPSH